MAEEPILFWWQLLDFSSKTRCVSDVGHVWFMSPLVVVALVVLLIVFTCFVHVFLDELQLFLAGRRLDSHIGWYFWHPALRAEVTGSSWVIQPWKEFSLKGEVAIGKLKVRSPTGRFGDGFFIVNGQNLCMLSGFRSKKNILLNRSSLEWTIIGGFICFSSPAALKSI